MRRTYLLLLVCLLLLLAGCNSPTVSQPVAVSTPSPTHTPTPTVAPLPTIPDVPARTVHFITSDHVQLAGLLYGHGRMMVICSHMLRTSKLIWSESGMPQRLAVLGYQVLAYDFRGNGDSAGQADPSVMDVDLRAATNFARQQGATTMVLMGASMGGTASLKVAAEEQVTAVLSLSGPQEFGVKISENDIKAIKAPKLFLVSENDESFITDAKHMYQTAGQPKELHIYPGRAHGTDILDYDSEDAVQRVLRFIEKYAPAS